MDALRVQRLRQVGHSMNMVAELPRYVGAKDVPLGLQVAAVDAFFVHLRLLIEFLARRRPQNDIHRDEYQAGFALTAVDPALAGRLHTDWELASQHVVHLSEQRVPVKGSQEVRYMSATDLRAYASDVFTAATLLQRHMNTTGSVYASAFHTILAEAESRRKT